MMNNDLQGLKSYLTDYVNRITSHRKGKFYNCPLCGSGNGKNKTPAFSIQTDEEHWKCFACNKSGDIYDLCAEYERLDSSGATKRIIELYGKQTGSPRRSVAAQDFQPVKQTEGDEPAQPATARPDYSDAIKRYADALEGSPAQSYLEGRGLTLDTMKRFNLGYDAKRRSVIIPYDRQGTYYGQRSIDPNAQMKHNNLKGVQIPLFNGGALYSADVVFVVESPLCAISITQEGGTAVAISGTSGGNRLLKQLKQKTTAAAIVLCLDNDDPGRKATKEIGAELEAFNGLLVINGTTAIMGDEESPDAADYRKDPNDVLQRSGAAALREAIAETVAAVQQAQTTAAAEAEAERADRTGAGMVDAFLQEVQTRKYEPMPTGIADIDKALSGGFTRQQLVILGAAPGAGKTALAQWIFEGMAMRGTPCVFVNLEMSRAQLLARSISRIAARQGNHIKPLEVLQGYKWDNAQQAAILAAAYEYKTKIAPCFIMNPTEVTSSLDTITAYMEAEAQRAEAAGHVAPLVVIDYLQLITGDAREDTAAVIKRAVFAFKSYAMKHNTLVFVIIAHNRQANSTGKVTMEAARDTSAIEYSADVQLGLTFTKAVVKKKNQDGMTTTTYRNIEDLTDEEKKYVTLKILKGRFGGKDTGVDLYFDGETMTYLQIAKDFIPTNEPTPFDKPMR